MKLKDVRKGQKVIKRGGVCPGDTPGATLIGEITSDEITCEGRNKYYVWVKFHTNDPRFKKPMLCSTNTIHLPD